MTDNQLQITRVRRDSEIGLDPKAFHELLPNFHLQVRLQTAEKFFALLGVHGGEVAEHFFARFIFRVLAQADADGDERRDGPDSNVRSGNHRTITNRKLPSRK